MNHDRKRAQISRIKNLAREKNVTVLAHFYQRPEIKKLADFVGGTDEIIAQALNTQAGAVMICGATFMAQTVRRLRPGLILLIARQDIRCPLAEAIGPEAVAEAHKRHPEALVVADVKAVDSVRQLADIEIAAQTAHQLPCLVGKQKIIMTPGPYWADWAGLGPQVVARWPEAICQVHEQVAAADLLTAKEANPSALTAVNVLCRPEVKTMADFVGDAAAIRDFCEESQTADFIIASESGLAESLTEMFPDKKFHETEIEIFCPNMKLTNLKAVLTTLEEFQNPNQSASTATI